MKTNRKFKVGMILFLAVICLIFGFSVFHTEQRKPKKKIAVVLKIIDKNNDFWTSFVQGVEMAAKEYEVEISVEGPDAETKYEEQGMMIQRAIEAKPDAILLIPANYTETLTYAKKIEEANIPLVLADSVMEESAGAGVVATDNVEAGRKMGAYIQENFNGISGIGIVGHVKGVSTAIEREQGLREGLGLLEDMIEEIVFCDSDYRKAYQVTKEMLERYPNINVIVGLNEYSSVGAARAVNDLGLKGKVRMIGFDSSLKEVEYLEDGTFDAIVVQKPLNMGYLCVEHIVRLLDKKEKPGSVDSGSVLITKETMYTEENQKLLFPF